MRARCLRVIVFLLVVASLAFGQGATASITGTVTDPSGLVVAGVAIEARNTETGAVYQAASTSAGNYTVPGLPVGTYVLNARSAGFKAYTHSNLALTAAQVLREDIPLEVGAATETITVSAEATLLKTESGELSHNVTLQQLDDLPLIVIGQANGLRNFLSSMVTLPGTYGGNGSTVINGLGQGFVTSEIVKVEGQDASNRLFNNYEYTTMNEPNVDAIQEIAFQTSNYAPEFGQAGSVVINTTMKSGTNQYHGTGFEYFVNEDLNAGYPFSVSGGPGSTSGGNGGKFRPRSRKNDFGGTLGGPISIPKLYNGKDKTFFYWSYEQYQLTQLFSFNDTVPTADFRNGDFSAVSPNGTCSLCAAYGIPTTPLGGATYTDALGRPIYANEIYDPLTRGTNPANGLGYANPFPGNVIPPSRFSPTAVAFQKLFPAPSPGNTNLTSNLSASVPGGQYSAIPALKIDQIISSKDKISGYWSRTNAESGVNSGPQAADGLPFSIGAYRGAFIPTTTIRLNYDRTLTPTILLHFGAGFLDTSFSDRAPFLSFDPSQFGLTGFVQNRQTPTISGMCTLGVAAVLGGVAPCASGGMQNIGTSGQLQSQIFEQRPTFNANATWVKGKHTFKFGAELELESVIGGNADFSGVTLAASSTTNLGATAQPFTPTVGFNGFNPGYGYANFLLGDFGSTSQTPSTLYSREGYQLWGFFAQDSWKVTRKLTVDYGLRYDYATPEHEQYGRLGQLDPTVANPNAGGRLGGYRYASTCNCDFYQSAYPYGIGPRIGAAYQIAPKTVLRAGWGFNYQFIANPAGGLVSASGAYPLSGINSFVNIQTPGSIVQPSWPVTNPTIYPVPGTAGVGGQTPTVPDKNENRPPRINQFSLSIQREITRDFVVEASYVANRAVWLAGTLGELSQISPQKYAQYGFYPYAGTGPCASGGGVCASTTYDNYTDRGLITQSLNSAAVVNHLKASGITNFLPYAGFPATNSLQSALYTFPQFGNLGITGSPTGNTKYDSLQIKVTKRLSHGLQAGLNYTWGQGFQRPTRQDFFNPASSVWQLQNIPLQVLNFNATYTVPKAGFLPRYVNAVSSDWQVGWYSSYQSGTYLTPPTSPTANFLTSQDIRVPGVPLYTPGVNINDHSTFNPYSTQILNPLAWQPCPANAVCASTSTFYKDFKGPRMPSENANIGRHFRLGKERKYDFYIRGEFTNIFNRTYFAFPTGATRNPQNPVTRGAGNGTILTAGFGVINAYLQPNTAYGFAGRSGTLIARFQF
ncbi:MAG TPA: TonB-dependent receptor [Bryobacteraceae bacterium]|nr:TonB-dependent receptor [Bryobacteraceae bacterium]